MFVCVDDKMKITWLVSGCTATSSSSSCCCNCINLRRSSFWMWWIDDERCRNNSAARLSDSVCGCSWSLDGGNTNDANDDDEDDADDNDKLVTLVVVVWSIADGNNWLLSPTVNTNNESRKMWIKFMEKKMLKLFTIPESIVAHLVSPMPQSPKKLTITVSTKWFQIQLYGCVRQ